MKRVLIVLLILSGAYAQDYAPLKLLQTIPLPGVEGRMDHLSVDLKGQRLFIAALENNTLKTVDLAQGKRIRSISGLKEPQGIVFVPELNQVFVASGGDGTLKAFEGTSLAQLFSHQKHLSFCRRRLH